MALTDSDNSQYGQQNGFALSTNERPSRTAKFPLIGLSPIFQMTPNA